MNADHEPVTIRDCGPRDGLQGEAPLPAADRAAIANGLAAAGVTDVEAVSFVSPRAVPAMAGAADVAQLLVPGNAVWWALVQTFGGASWRSMRRSITSR
jgi:hydroxymethylglutaryl-CoA lyase